MVCCECCFVVSCECCFVVSCECCIVNVVGVVLYRLWGV